MKLPAIDIQFPRMRSYNTIRDDTTLFHILHTVDGILEIRKLITTGDDLYIVVYSGWEERQYAILPFGEGKIVNNTFRWVYSPERQYKGHDVDIEVPSAEIKRVIEWFINKDS